MCQVTAKNSPLTTPPPPPSSKSQLNPYAEPFKPFKNAFCIINAPVIHFYHPLPVSSSYTCPLGKNKQKKKHFARTRQQIWQPVKLKSDSNKNSDDEDYIDHQVLFAGGNTTLMIKNIPNRLKRHELLQILDSHCCEENMKAKLHSDFSWSKYDFLYLPMDFCYGANLGYAFVNFTTTVAAVRFAKAFHKRGWEAQVPGNKKICEISRAAIQGIDALKNHFEHLRFNCHTDSYLPVMLSPPSDGQNHANATIIGKRIDPVWRRKLPLTMRRKALMK